MREAYYHEDDFCMIELLPLDNLQHCLTQMGEQQAFADAHKQCLRFNQVGGDGLALQVCVVDQHIGFQP